ncbi:MAG: lipoprotein-releasing ABC transporter permease subunit [Cellvibrionaceae bacterium]
MFTPVPAFIGLRYTRSRRENRFISFVSGFSLLGMALGVFALVVVLSVMNGFDREIKQRLLKVVPHGYIESTNGVPDWQSLREQVSNHPEVVDAAPFVKGRALLAYHGDNAGAELVGVVPDTEDRVSAIPQTMIAGDFYKLVPGEFNIVLGQIVASKLGVGVGDRIQVNLPSVTITPAGMFPRYKRFKVVGVFQAGAQVDAHMAIVHMDDARRLFRYPAAAQGLRVKLTDQQQAPRILNELLTDSLNLSGLSVTSWQQTQGSLFAAIKMEKRITTLLLTLIIIVAAFNIVSSLVMSVGEKRHDIAVLRTLGATPKQIMAVFMTQGMATGLAGALLGLLFGLPMASYLPELTATLEDLFGIHFFDPSVYFISYLPSDLRWGDVIYTFVAALLLNAIATLYPAWRASLIKPAEALEYH